MFIDSYKFNKPIAFSHEVRVPDYLSKSFVVFLIFVIPAFAFLLILGTGKTPSFWLCISFAIWVCTIPFVLKLDKLKNSNFFYIVKFDENSFSIGTSFEDNEETSYFSRKTNFKFNERKHMVYIRNSKGYECAYYYDERFRKFLEEIKKF